MKHAKRGEKIALKLTAAERTLLLEGPVRLPPTFERLIEGTPPSEPVMLLPDNLVSLSVYVGAAAHYTPDMKPQKKLTAIYQKILRLLADHRSATAVNVHEPKKTKLFSRQADAPANRPARPKKPADRLFQFKITLMRVEPTIWRRIQVKDCTLDKLHEHIQTSMGWTNSHLHQFKMGEQRYGDPMLMEEDFEEFGYEDSTSTNLSEVLPKSGKRFRFVYEYDFGDSWDHEVAFEGCPKAEAGRRYPLCLEGERACPPEDVGGARSYANFLEAIGNKKHDQHEEMMKWVGGSFDPEEFDPVVATKSMKKGLPDWRKEPWV